MMLRKSRILLLLILTLVFVACKKQKPVNFHFGYFGLEPGRYVVYDVMEINHDQALAQHDTVYYQLKTVWGDTVIDNEGRIAREFLRYTRPNASSNWQITDVWTGIIDGIRAELVEENQRVVKLVFSPSISKSWDANNYNMLGEMLCYYTDIHDDYTINGQEFDSTLIVEQADFTSLIDTVRKYEVYRKGTGLIRKYLKDNHYQFGSPEVNKGTELYMNFITSGFE